MPQEEKKPSIAEQQSPRAAARKLDPETEGEKPRMRTEDMPSYTPQGRAEPAEGEIANEAPSYTPQEPLDSDET
jgi:hypothetical protein